MSVNNMLGRLAEIGAMMEKWNDATAVDEIEKDIVLEKLRRLYLEIKNMNGQVAEEIHLMPVPDAANAAAEYTNAEEACGELTEAPQDRLETKPAEPAVSAEEENLPAEEQNINELQSEFSRSEDASPEDIPETDKDTYNVGADVADALISNQLGKSESAERDEKLKKRKAIMSLYDDSEEESADEQAPAIVEQETVTVTQVEQAVSVTQTEVTESREVSHSGETSQSVVIGDLLASGERTIGDSYANGNSSDVASKISSSNITRLRSSIGLNDKFLLIRDLFSGDAEAYDEAISKLEEFRDLDNALLFIHDNYRWNPNSEGAVLLVDLLTKKLS